jgi:hypothetical protein
MPKRRGSKKSKSRSHSRSKKCKRRSQKRYKVNCRSGSKRKSCYRSCNRRRSRKSRSRKRGSSWTRFQRSLSSACKKVSGQKTCPIGSSEFSRLAKDLYASNPKASDRSALLKSLREAGQRENVYDYLQALAAGPPPS